MAGAMDLDPVAAVGELVGRGGVLVLSGAGLSTESGIPDYRGPSGALRRHTPMTFQSFMTDPVARHRYWARSYLGWRQIDGARPNAGHRSVTELQRAGLLTGIVTQNVDGLHQAADAVDVIELHGGLDRVICQSCGQIVDRAAIDLALRAANRNFEARLSRINPDGDAELDDAELAGFVMIDCESCGGGPLKPDVVFFGETVPRGRVERCFELVDAARSVLVLGSSLQVMSGFRFVLRAHRLGIPVAIINQGPTRGDRHTSIRVDGALGTVLPTVAAQINDRRGGRTSPERPFAAR
jgi:NAD-dependent SIR2 family protein deacetylase